MARYINKHTDYVESHTALDDSRVEFELARLFVDRHFTEFKKDFLNNVKSVSWTLLRDRLSSAEKMRKREVAKPIEDKKLQNLQGILNFGGDNK